MSQSLETNQQATQRHFTANIPVPSKLDLSGQLEQNWRKFSRQWKNYSIASRLIKEPKEYQCAVLLACIGEEAQEIYDGLHFEDDEDQNDIDTVINKFEIFCVGTTNEIYESYKFYTRKQEQEETIDSYVAVLRKLAKTCNFKDPERMIRDRVVIGIHNDAVREKLLEQKDLTLDKATQICRAHEASISQTKSMSSSNQELDVSRLRQSQRQYGKPSRDSRQYPENGGQQSSTFFKQPPKYALCSRCGRNSHKRDACLAKNAECRKCHKIGHYAAFCRSKKIQKFAEVEEEDDELFLNNEDSHMGTIVGEVTSDPWMVTVKMDQQELQFKIDTGADVTVIPERMTPIGKRPLQKVTKKFFGPGRTRITVLGKFTAKLTYKERSCNDEVYVVKGLEEPLLGRPAIKALQLIKLVDQIAEKQVTSYLQEFPRLFRGLGKLKYMYKISLKADAKPYAVSTPRSLALPLKEKVKAELESLEQQDVIKPVTQPTDWCAPIVVVPKPNNKVRVCVDLTKLNESVRRENFPLPTTDDLLAQLDGATVFTKLDCNSGFYQIPLDEESQLLTTFITPFGRFCYKRLPFGISSGPEVFQRSMTQLLAGQEGVICDIDDILIHGRIQNEHDTRLRQVLQKLQAAGATLNEEKCQFSQTKVKFLGHIITKEGVAIDPDKVKAIKNFPTPTNLTDLRRFMGMVNHVSKFAGCQLADNNKALRDLLKQDNDWIWGESQEIAFNKMKQQLISAPVLAHYSPNKKTKISADASSYGLGTVLSQKQGDGSFKPVFFASRSLTKTEQRYAQVEKEALAVTWACEKFSNYIIGLKDLTLETDHKPLLALLKTKSLDELSPRIQRFRMKLMRYNYNIIYTRGKNLLTADALSRAPLPNTEDEEKSLEEEVELHVHTLMQNFPATKGRMEEIKRLQQSNTLYQTLMNYCRVGWPNSCPEDPQIKPYWIVRFDLSVQEDILLYRSRLVIPEKLRSEMLERLHTGHQGIVKTRAFASNTMWWPGLSSQIETFVEKCPICTQERKIKPEPLIPTPTPEYPWQKIGTDLFELNKQTYLLVVDYYSRYIEIALLQNTTATHVINHMKSIFSRHGIPETVVSDNGPQFTSHYFKKFSEVYGFQHTYSSPYYPQSNGEAERAVQTIKNLMKKAEDPYLALMMYRATPLQNGRSPAELLMGRKIRTTVPIMKSNLIPKQNKEFRQKDMKQKAGTKDNFDRAHRARDATALYAGQPVWVKPQGTPGTVIRPLGDRSYEVATPFGKQRRNRRLLIPRHLEGKVNIKHPKENSLIPKEIALPVMPTDAFESEHETGSRQPATPVLSEPHVQPLPISKSIDKQYTRYGREIKKPKLLDL